MGRLAVLARVGALVLGAAISLGGCASAATDEAPAAAQPSYRFPAHLQQKSVELSYLGTRAWTGPVVDENPRLIYVFADQGGTATTCSVTPVAHVVDQTADAVSVLVGIYGVVQTGGMTCAAVSNATAVLPLTLDQPLGARPVLDAGDHNKTHSAVLRSVVPKLTTVPSGYTESALSQSVAGATSTRGYTDKHGNALQIQIKPSGTPQLGTVRGHTTVRGHPATIYWTSGFEQDIMIAWNDGRQQKSLYQMSVYLPRFPPQTLAQLEQLAASVQ